MAEMGNIQEVVDGVEKCMMFVPDHKDVNCPRVAQRISCEKCGYPASEALVIAPPNDDEQKGKTR